MDTVGSLRYPDYSFVDQTISELSAQEATDSPTVAPTTARVAAPSGR